MLSWNRIDYSMQMRETSRGDDKKLHVNNNGRTMMGYDRFTGKYTINGRGNLSPMTLILPKLGLDYGIALKQREKADEEGFFKRLEETADLIAKELVARANYMMSQSPKSAPFISASGFASA